MPAASWPARPAAFVERVRTFLAATPGAAIAGADRRQTERRGRRSDEGEAAGNVVRVDFRRLDAMLEVLGEGLIQHSSLMDLYRRLSRRVGACTELEELDQTVLSLQKTLT